MESSEFHPTTTTKLMRIAELSRRDSRKQFNSLMHHYNVESLRVCYQELDGKKALGADGVVKSSMERALKQMCAIWLTACERCRIGQVRCDRF